MTLAGISVILFCVCFFGTIDAGRYTYDRNYGHEKPKPNPKAQGKTAEIHGTSYGVSDFLGILNKFGKPIPHEPDLCEDVFQYPINLPIDATIAKYGKLDLKGFQYTYDGTISYEDGDIIITLTHDKDILISEGGLCGTYYLYQIRIKTPSANTVAGIHYPVAIQYIFVNTLYESYEVASTHADGLAVAVVFITVGSESNPAFDVLLDNIEQLGDGDNALDDPFSPGSLLPGELCSFFRYRGKFNVESCAEIATFTLFTDTIQISEGQLQELLEFLADQLTTTEPPTTTTEMSTPDSTTTEMTTAMTPTTTDDDDDDDDDNGSILEVSINKRRKKPVQQKRPPQNNRPAQYNRPQQHKKPRILDFSAYKPRRGPIVTIQPIMFCKSPLLDKSGFPWYLFHKQ